MLLGERLTALREQRGESLQEVADAVGVSKPHIWALEKGSTKNPSVELVRCLANHYGVSFSFLSDEHVSDRGLSPAIKAFALELSELKMSVDDLDVLRALAEALYQRKTKRNVDVIES